MLREAYQACYTSLVYLFENKKISEAVFARELFKLNDKSFTDARADGTLKESIYSGIDGDLVSIPKCRI